mgnify:CR=1 FL=1
MTKTRFDLEEAIMHCWATVDDLDLLAENMLAKGDVDAELLANTLIGLRQLHHMRVEKVFDIFSDLIKAGTIA